MIPGSTPDDRRDGRLSDAEPICKPDLCPPLVVELADLSNRCIGELRQPGSFALCRKPGLPTPRNHVGDVVGLGSQEEVSRSNTKLVVAAVKDEQAIRNRPKVKLPGDLVSPHGATSAATNADLSIASSSGARGPQPASPGLANLLKEAISESYPFPAVRHMPRLPTVYELSRI